MKSVQRLLADVLHLPTAPKRETAVINFIQAFAARHRLSVRTDHFGNLFVRSGRGRPRCIVSAHMDHPGVEVVRMRGNIATVKMIGGLNPQQICRARWRFFPDPPHNGHTVTGQGTGGLVIDPILRKGKKIAHFRVRLSSPVPRGTFGMFDLPPVRFAKGMVHARVIDNLANCAVVLEVLRVARQRRVSIIGLFTRNEEMGCIGAKAIARDRGLPRRTPIVVLEASAASVTSPHIGGGPVIRVGDRLTSYHPLVDLWLHAAAARLAKQPFGLRGGPRQPTSATAFRFQRALMVGGANEASVYGLAGLMVGQLALPLGNYHNRGPRGAAPEYIAWRDWWWLRQLLIALLDAPSPTQVAQFRRRQPI